MGERNALIELEIEWVLPLPQGFISIDVFFYTCIHILHAHLFVPQTVWYLIDRFQFEWNKYVGDKTHSKCLVSCTTIVFLSFLEINVFCLKERLFSCISRNLRPKPCVRINRDAKKNKREIEFIVVKYERT